MRASEASFEILVLSLSKHKDFDPGFFADDGPWPGEQSRSYSVTVGGGWPRGGGRTTSTSGSAASVTMHISRNTST